MPYPGKIDEHIYVADGIAFSSRLSTRIPKSLDYIYKALGEGRDALDLTHWANDGILLLNCALTFPIKGKSGAHIALWRPFITEVLRLINEKKEGIAFGLMGAPAKVYHSIITAPSHGVFSCEHPAAPSYHGGTWKHANIFSRIASYHRFMNNIEMKW